MEGKTMGMWAHAYTTQMQLATMHACIHTYMFGTLGLLWSHVFHCMQLIGPTCHAASISPHSLRTSLHLPPSSEVQQQCGHAMQHDAMACYRPAQHSMVGQGMIACLSAWTEQVCTGNAYSMLTCQLTQKRGHACTFAC